MTKKLTLLEKVYTVLIAVYPILSIYATFFNDLSVADLLLIVLSIALTFEMLRKNKLFILKYTQTFKLFLFYILLSFVIQFVAGTGVGFLSTIRYLLYLYCLISFSSFFNFSLGIKGLELFAITSSVYLIIQFIAFRFFSVVLPWHLPLKVIDQNFDLLVESPYYLEYYRPTGFFYEPTHFSQYCLIYLSYLLFLSEGKGKWIKVIITCVAILCSGSSAGLFMVAILFALFLLENLFSGKKVLQSLAIILLVLVGFFVILNIPYFSTIVNRVFVNGSFSGAAVGYRFDSVETLFDGSRSIIELAFGTGRGTENDQYFTAIFYIINAHGFVGLFIYLLIFIALFVKCNNSFSRNVLIVVFILSIGSEMVCNFGILTYFTYLLAFNSLNKVKVSNRQTQLSFFPIQQAQRHCQTYSSFPR